MDTSFIYIILFFGFVVWMIWRTEKQEEKERKEPLSSELKNHYFIKTILDITDIIKNLKEESEIKLFLEKQVGTGDKRPITETTQYHDYQTEVMTGQTFGALGTFLTSDSREKTYKIAHIGHIQDLWSYYLFSKINKDKMSKEEKRKIYKDIDEKLALLSNAKVLSLTNQTDIKKAWMTIIDDKALTPKILNQLIGEVKRALLLDSLRFKDMISNR